MYKNSDNLTLNDIIYLLSNNFDTKSFYFEKIINILKCPNPKNELYVEKHHILPKSLYPLYKRNKSNIIKLSSYNHMMIHYYMFKCSNNKNSYYKMMNVIYSCFGENSSSFSNLNEKELNEKLKIISEIRKNNLKLGTTNGKHCYTNGKINVFKYKCPKGFWKGMIRHTNNNVDRKSYIKILYEDMKNKNILLKYNIHNFNEFKHWYGINNINVDTNIENCKINDKIIEQKGLFCKEKTNKIYKNIEEIKKLYYDMKNNNEIKNNGDRNIFSKFRKWTNKCYGLGGCYKFNITNETKCKLNIDISSEDLSYNILSVVKINEKDYKDDIIYTKRGINIDLTNYNLNDDVCIYFGRLTPNLIKLI